MHHEIPSWPSIIKVNFVLHLSKIIPRPVSAVFSAAVLFSAIYYFPVIRFFYVISLFQGIEGIKALPFPAFFNTFLITVLTSFLNPISSLGILLLDHSTLSLWSVSTRDRISFETSTHKKNIRDKTVHLTKSIMILFLCCEGFPRLHIRGMQVYAFYRSRPMCACTQLCGAVDQSSGQSLRFSDGGWSGCKCL